MLKVVVFDGGWGGENVANYLERELNIIEVIRIIDWAHAPYQNKTLAQICALAKQALAGFINKVDAIILGGYIPTLAIEYLRYYYPNQVFIGVGIDRDYLFEAKESPRHVMLLMNTMLRESEIHQAVRQHFPNSRISTPNCSNLEGMSDAGLDTVKYLPAELASGSAPPDLVLLLNTHFWHLHQPIQALWSWRTQVIDFRKKLLRDLCIALKLRGVDGGRPL